ncbi:hypothetical protein GCM10011411_05240 [Aurantiacibacter arachoides]|nr:hypothetical protein GCM10011411_05240 [Aurantiacibacter arachoides]
MMGNDGVAIGTVLANDGTTVVLDTGTWQVPLGPDAFAQNEGTWTLNTTKAELETAYSGMVAEQEAALASALTVGAEVVTADAQALGPVSEVNDTTVVVTHMDTPLALPREAFAVDGNGTLMVRADMAAIMAAMNGAG